MILQGFSTVDIPADTAGIEQTPRAAVATVAFAAAAGLASAVAVAAALAAVVAPVALVVAAAVAVVLSSPELAGPVEPVWSCQWISADAFAAPLQGKST